MRTDGSTTKDIAFTTGSNISGNAATATALATGRTVTLTGAVTGVSGTFNGTANLSFSTTLAAGQAVTSLTSSTITVSASTGAVTLSLPQSIATNSAVTFGSATLGNINISSTANTIATSATNNLILAPATAATAVTGSLAVSTALTVGTTSGLSGAVTLGSTLALSVAGAKIALGNATAASATTSINLGSGASGTSSTGDLILRVPTGRLAHLVANDTPTFAPTSNDLIITKGVMDTAITTATNGFMTSSGATRSTAGDQTLGVGADSGSFLVKTGLTPTTRLTIANNGAATFANALTVSTGGLNIVAGGLTVSGTTAITGALSATLNVTAATAPSTSSHLTNKAYVDGLFSVNPHTIVSRTGYSEGGPIGWAKAGPLYFQWGRAINLVDGGSSGGNQRDVYFPVAFPNACLSVQLHAIHIETNNTASAAVYAGTMTTTKFMVGWNGGWEDNIHWFAIGY